jgi:hypothetical protein
MPLERILDLRVHERDQAWLRAIGGEARQRAVDNGFVAVLVRVVMDLHGHDQDATPRPPRDERNAPAASDYADGRVAALGLPATASLSASEPSDVSWWRTSRPPRP